jgi:hypothetical protein
MGMNGSGFPPAGKGRLCAAGLLLAGAVALSACGHQQTGDFGRRADNVLTRDILPAQGKIHAWMRGEPTSLYPFTGDEIELRDRAWRFLTPVYETARLQRYLAELSYTRVLPPMPHEFRNHYHLHLMTDDYRSASSRYFKIGADIEADRQLMMPFSQTATRVCAADRFRIERLNSVGELTETQREHAVARVTENRMIVEWVRRDMREKAAAYRYALEHVSIEAPMAEAIRAERALIALESAQQSLDYWDGCGDNKTAFPPMASSRQQPVRGAASGGSGRYAPASPRAIEDRRGMIRDDRPPK